MVFMLIHHYRQPHLKVIRAQIDQLLHTPIHINPKTNSTYLYELLDILLVFIRLFLVNHKNETINVGRVVAPQVRILPIQVPNLEAALLSVLKFKVIKSISEEDLLDGLQEATVGGLAGAVHADHNYLVDALGAAHAWIISDGRINSITTI